MRNLGSRIVNNWIYPVEKGYVLIDTGYENGFRRFKKRLEQLRIGPEAIRYVFLTHAHDDHAGFLNQLLAESPHIKVIMSPRALEILYRGQNSFQGGCTSRMAYCFCQLMKLFGKGAHRFPPMESRFEERCLLISEANRKELEGKLGGTILFTPGHTADSISLLLNDGILFCGDAAMNGFPSARRITIYAEEKNDFSKSWEIIIAAKPKLIYPGHGKPFPVGNLARRLPYVRAVKLYPLKNAE